MKGMHMYLIHLLEKGAPFAYIWFNEWMPPQLAHPLEKDASFIPSL